jgi:L-2,4-diaminobutyrate decarboxylase
MSFTSDASIITAALDDYYQESLSGQKPVINQAPMARLVEYLGLAKHVRDGGLTGEKLSAFLSEYLSTATRLHSPAYLGHQVAVPHYAGALGSLVDGFTNNAMAIYEMGPGAASIEYFMINWLLEKAGWQPAPLNPSASNRDEAYGAGVLTNGGSLANLTALIAARSKLVPGIWEEGDPGDLAILATPQSHYSIARAAGILGIGHKSIYALEVDERAVILPDRLEQAYDRLKSDGKRAVALVASACSTSAGLYDPLEEIAAFCRGHGIWLHVDGAHGASALLSQRYKHLLKGVELADSLIWDAHKMLRVPTLCAAVLLREHRNLDLAFEQEASYLFHEKEQPGIDLIERTVECTKAGLGLRLFMVVAALGERGLAEYIDRQYDLAGECYQYMCQQSDFECPVQPQANIICFRLPGSDERQLKLREALIARGNFYITTTEFNNKRYLRLVFMNPDTSLDDVKRLVSEIRSFA